MVEKPYSRPELVLLAKLYESTEKFPLMFECINDFVKLNPAVSKEERDILNAGYKNMITNQRRSWRELVKVESKEKDNEKKHAYARELRVEVEKEIITVADKILEMVGKYLLEASIDKESRVFFYKMKADYLRYKAEVSLGEDYTTFYKESAAAYAEGQKLSEALPITDNIRLGLTLNYSVLYYEVILNKEQAVKIARSAYEEAMKIIDELDRNVSKDTMLLIQLLKENLNMWNNDNEEEQSI